jgi:hypothetical protein
MPKREVNKVHTSAEKWRFLQKTKEPIDQENNVEFPYLSYQTVPSMLVEYYES